LSLINHILATKVRNYFDKSKFISRKMKKMSFLFLFSSKHSKIPQKTTENAQKKSHEFEPKFKSLNL